ncbi:MAG: hypothetical protein PHY45_11705 [Rhodocyclaceae bacterium]|nr:hypothetical protein [Rhodocyclaceae bacterium]
MAKNDKTTTVTAKVPIHHDGFPKAAGDEFDVNDKQLEQLLAVGAVEVVAADPAPAPATKK